MSSGDNSTRPGKEITADIIQGRPSTPVPTSPKGTPTPSRTSTGIFLSRSPPPARLPQPTPSSRSLSPAESSLSPILSSSGTTPRSSYIPSTQRANSPTPQATVIETQAVYMTSKSSEAAPLAIVTTRLTKSTSRTDRTTAESTTLVVSSSTSVPPPAAQSSEPAERPEEHSPLSNGATAGIVLAVVAVLIGTFFLVRYIYRRRGFCCRGRRFSPVSEPYHRPPPGPISRPIPQNARPHSWLSRPGGQSYPSVMITPNREEPVELQTFTRPAHGPRMYDVGHSGNALVEPAYNRRPASMNGTTAPTYDGYPAQDAQEPATVAVAPPQPAQAIPISPESPTPSSTAQDGRIEAAKNRTGAIPWEDNYRYRAW